MSSAQDQYPSKPVKLVVGFPPGGGNDILARLVGEKLQTALGQPFIVENKPGANGIIAIEQVKRAAADGYMLLVGPSSGMTVNPALYADLPYDPIKDFAPVSMVGLFPLILTVHPSVAAKTTAELIAIAKASPGRINYSSAATSFQLATEMFAQRAGIALNHIPYKGSAPAVNAVLSGEVALTFADSAAVMAQIKAGKLRAIAVSSAKRVRIVPELPTIAESGVPGYEMVLWSGIFAPAGTLGALTTRLQKEIAQVVFQPDLRERMMNLGVEPVGSTAAELSATMKAQISQYKQVAAKGNIKAQ
ncbi:MAG: tripartite tricarboxylate transporter substrate binding protein [Betaproteobacteria bacterium]|nr:tripartite tricarboxylate transporter substrate binding protein [Betaproteobacteria bacterium]